MEARHARRRTAVPRVALKRAFAGGDSGLFWMAAAAAWAVAIYVRGQRPAWITVGAGARIGLVTGLLAAWLAFSISGATLFVDRFVLQRLLEPD